MKTKVIGYCARCGIPMGPYNNEGELQIAAAQQKQCTECSLRFIFKGKNQIENLNWRKVPFPAPTDTDFWDLIHPTIRELCIERFNGGHYADSVEASLKEINKRVKEIVKIKTGEERDGADLMYHAFPIDNPLIVLDDLTTTSGKDIQDGYMHIFAGAMRGIRNPKAHDNITITPERAIHFIFLASLLMQKLDESK